MITTANYLLRAIVSNSDFYFEYEDCGDVWTALEQFWHDDYPEVLPEHDGSPFPIDVIAMEDGKAIQKYEFTFNAVVFHAFFDKGHTVDGIYTLDQFAKDIERKKEPVIYRQLRRKSVSGEIETFPIVSENYDDMDELCEKLNKFTGCDGEFQAIPWDASKREWEDLQKIFFVVGGDAKPEDKPDVQQAKDIIALWSDWCMGYDDENLWLDYMVKHPKGHCNRLHLQEKWDYCYEEYGHRAAMHMFWRELDNDNRTILTEYITTEWHKD